MSEGKNAVSTPQEARAIRDEQWRFMERVEELGGVWWTPWNKSRRQQLADEQRDCLLSGMERREWFDAHPDWWAIGEWSSEREACLIELTEAGRTALVQRHLYDMEPVTGGLVEPGWSCVPAPFGNQS